MASSSISTLPPGGLLEIVFSFDTTGSMSSILDEVRGRLQDMIQRLQSDIPGIRIGVIAHGDYCDKDVFYLTKELDLCQNVAELCQFVQDIDGTGGGDTDECYELVLRMVRQNFSWTARSQKILVMIGDANPHEPDYAMNIDNINWREELKLMNCMKIKVYGVQVFDNTGVDEFYKTLASETDGHYLKLTEFSNITDMMMAICYAERGEDFLMNYENEVRSREKQVHGGTGSLPKDLEGMFGTLRRDDSTKSMSSVTPVTLAPTIHLPLIASKPPVKIATVKPMVTRKERKHQLKVKEKKKKTERPLKEFRENISTIKYDSRCKCKTSTKWQLVYSPDKPCVKGWRCRRLRNNNIYWKKNIVFPKLSNDKGIYELAVQTKAKGRLHVVYSFAVSTRKSTFMNTIKWERTLFQSKSQQGRVMRVIRNVTADRGCRVFLRRIKYSKKAYSESNQFDFAWRHGSSRTVVKNGIFISGIPDPMDTH